MVISKISELLLSSNLLLKITYIDARTGLPTEINGFVKVFIIMGTLLFAKQLPKLIQDLTGISLDGKFTINPFKKVG